MKKTVHIENVADLERAAQEFLEKIGDRTLVAFFAPMGAGKTTFTTAICRILGVTDPVGSPTFAIVNEYRGGRLDIAHFDVYRIADVEEMDEIGYEDCFYGQGLCLVEWANLIEEILPEHYSRITIEKDLEKGFDYRRITIEEI